MFVIFFVSIFVAEIASDSFFWTNRRGQVETLIMLYMTSNEYIFIFIHVVAGVGCLLDASRRAVVSARREGSCVAVRGGPSRKFLGGGLAPRRCQNC